MTPSIRRGLATLAVLGLVVATISGCGDSEGPSLNGPAYISVSVDGSSVPSLTPFIGCADFGLRVSVFATGGLLPNTTGWLEMNLAEFSKAGTYSLADSTTGRFGRVGTANGTPPVYYTSSSDPSQIVITAVSFSDSLIAGSFSLHLYDSGDPGNHHTITGKFRQPLVPMYTVQYPEGTPCYGAR